MYYNIYIYIYIYLSIHCSMGSAPVGAQCPLTSSLGEFLGDWDWLWYPGLSPVLVSIALPFAFHFLVFSIHSSSPAIGFHSSIFHGGQCSKWKISRNGTLVKILEHSEEQFMFSSYNQSRRNGTLIPLHLTNRNGVPVRSGPFRALGRPTLGTRIRSRRKYHH